MPARKNLFKKRSPSKRQKKKTDKARDAQTPQHPQLDDVDAIAAAYRVADLRAMLADAGLPTEGTKTVLAQALHQHAIAADTTKPIEELTDIQVLHVLQNLGVEIDITKEHRRATVASLLGAQEQHDQDEEDHMSTDGSDDQTEAGTPAKEKTPRTPATVQQEIRRLQRTVKDLRIELQGVARPLDVPVEPPEEPKDAVTAMAEAISKAIKRSTGTAHDLADGSYSEVLTMSKIKRIHPAAIDPRMHDNDAHKLGLMVNRMLTIDMDAAMGLSATTWKRDCDRRIQDIHALAQVEASPSEYAEGEANFTTYVTEIITLAAQHDKEAVRYAPMRQKQLLHWIEAWNDIRKNLRNATRYWENPVQSYRLQMEDLITTSLGVGLSTAQLKNLETTTKLRRKLGLDKDPKATTTSYSGYKGGAAGGSGASYSGTPQPRDSYKTPAPSDKRNINVGTRMPQAQFIIGVDTPGSIAVDTTCFSCNQPPPSPGMGHRAWECPCGFSQKHPGRSMPGFTSRGIKHPPAWDGDNPKADVQKQWDRLKTMGYFTSARPEGGTMIDLQPARLFAPDILRLGTAADPRDVARAVPLGPQAASEVLSELERDLSPVRKAILLLSTRAFRLALSHLLPSLDIRATALLHERHTPHHTHNTLHLFTHITYWHYIALHPTIITHAWNTAPSTRLQLFIAAVTAKIGTHAPPATLTGTLAPPPHDSTSAQRYRLGVFIRRALITAPHLTSLHHALSRPLIASLSSDEKTLTLPHPQHSTEARETWILPPINDTDRVLLATFHDQRLVAVASEQSLAGLALPQASSSAFLHPSINWLEPAPISDDDDGRARAEPPEWFRQRLAPGDIPPRRYRLKPIPTFHASSVIRKAHRWKKRLGRFLGQATSIILEGKLCLPLDIHEIEPMDRANLPTCFETPEATAFVDAITAEYLVSNVISWYPAHSPPLCICPIGVVPKKTAPFYRLIIDARGPNAVTSKWCSNMRSLASAAHLFQPGSVCFSLDIGKAYIVSPYQGCKQRFTWRMRADGTPYIHVGCTPDECSLTCSKTMLGFRWRGHLFAFNAPMFGARVSGNILDTLLAPIDRWARARGLPFLRWVDDSIFCVPPSPEHRHDTTSCGGYEHCFLCKQTMDHALATQEEVYDLLTDLGFTFNEKRTPPAQRGEFIGLGWDTLQCTFRIVEGKAEKMATAASGILSTVAASPRELAQLRGKLNWFSPCLYAVRLLTRAINRFVGSPEDDDAWDVRTTLPSNVQSEISHWFRTLTASAVHQRPMWKLKPAQLLAAYHAGRPIVQAYIETDASLQGWGCQLTIIDRDERVTHRASARWLQQDPTIQVQCEAEALHQAILTFRALLRGKSVLHATDCDPTVALPERGSARSERLQRTALSVWQLCSMEGIFMASAWVPGDHMLLSGTDALSREALIDKHSATLRPEGWQIVQRLAASRAMHLAVDWFADHSNHQLPYFWSRSPHHQAEGTDALAAPSWSRSRCTICQQDVASCAYLFPPVPLVDRVVAKALHDRSRGIIVAPRIISATWWPILVSSAVSDFIYIPVDYINTQVSGCDSSYQAYNWICVAFNFGDAHAPDNDYHNCSPAEHTAPDVNRLTIAHEQLQSRLAAALLQENPPETD